MASLQRLSCVFLALLGAVVSDKQLSAYGDQFGAPLNQYGSNDLLAAESSPLESYANNGAPQDPIAALTEVIPGVPGEDYPILAEVPETAFTCEGQVEGGYYADPEAQCQAFHICGPDAGASGLTKYSFLCPNGTLFNQEYFICDWWFNFDCAQAEELYSRNEEIAAEREALGGLLASGSAPTGYGSPSNSGYESANPPASAYGSPQPTYTF
ncbi:Putative LOC100168286 [Caligus rogercresseyi]|uniref:LOC100168286 n=1 Tax=Caligus rogercresseyi TaxID=217165 RepID=A0A7T8HJH7_CALRO|nr:Putative LOC100168286 [Caligus rogercresseyi]